MFKVGQKVRVIDKNTGVSKHESIVWRDLEENGMMGEIVSNRTPESKVVLVKALGEKYTTNGTFLKSDVCHWSQIFLGEVEEL